ncbi:hypothetical protein EXIGLDRAFT_576778, partial [Exidia glandulosa HHB12029]
DDGPADGVEVVRDEEYDPDLDEAMLNLPLADERVLSEREARCVKKFDDALAAMTYDACTQCRERDWDLGLRDGVCKRCRSDHEDVRRWSAENNTNPS